MDWVLITVGAIFFICIIVGICRGAIRIAVSLLTTLLTLVIVVFATPYVADAIAKYTPMDEMIVDKVSSAMTSAANNYLTNQAREELGGTFSEEEIRKALDAAGISETQLQEYGISVNDIAEGNISSEQLERLGIAEKLLQGNAESQEEGAENVLGNIEIPREVQQEAIKSADLPDVFKNLLTVNNNDEIYKQLGVTTFAQYVGSFLAKLIINIVAFLCTFLIVTIVLRAIVFALDIVAELPVLGLVNRLAGGAIGAVGALIIVWLLFIVVTLAYTTVIGKDVYGAIQGNGILKMIYDNNLIMKLATKI